MSDATDDDDAPLPQSPVTAARLLSGLAQLISELRTISDVSQETLQQAIGTDLTRYEDGDYGTGAQLTTEWNFGLDFHPDAIGGPMLDFEFFPVQPNGHPDLSGVGDVDLDRFAAVLTGAGYHQTPWIGEHGRRLGQYFDRDRLRVTVVTQGAANPAPDQPARLLIRGVKVQ